MSLFATSCLGCGRRIESGTYCPACAQTHGAPSGLSERQRNARHRYRRHYATTEYRRNRLARLEATRDRLGIAHCEWPGCGRAIGVEPHDWESDHHVTVRDADSMPGFDVDAVDNLRCYCVEHARAKTRSDRAMRRVSRLEKGSSDR